MSGLHSTVTSQSAARGTASRIPTNSSAGSSDGVPPPKKTLVAGGTGCVSHRRVRSRTQAAAYASIRWWRSVQVAKSQ